VLLDSNYTLSLLDNSLVWTDPPAGGSFLNVISSNADLIVDYPNDVILDIVLKELHVSSTSSSIRRPVIKSRVTMTWTTRAAMFKQCRRRTLRQSGGQLGKPPQGDV